MENANRDNEKMDEKISNVHSTREPARRRHAPRRKHSDTDWVLENRERWTQCGATQHVRWKTLAGGVGRRALAPVGK